MDSENGIPKELPDEPQHIVDIPEEGENLSNDSADALEVEQEAPALSGELPDASEVIQQAEALSNEQGEPDVTQPEPILPDAERGGQDIPVAEEEMTPLPEGQTGVPIGPQTAASVPTRPRSKYRRWFQVLSGVLLLLVIGGIVLVVQAQQHKSSPGKTVRPALTPTPIPPLNVTNWCVVNSAPVDAQMGQVSLNKVLALSSNDAWLLGSTDKGNIFKATGRHFPLLEHWNGKAWSIVPTADTSALLKQMLTKLGGGPASEIVDLSDIAVLSANNIWAVGNISVEKFSPFSQAAIPSVMLQSAGQPLIEHWDGNTWQIVASSSGTSGVQGPFGFDQLTNISAISANDIWLTGTKAVKTKILLGNSTVVIMSPVLLVEHWDGTSWTEKELPSSVQNTSLSLGALQALSSDDVWSFSAGVHLKLVSIAGFQPVSPSALPPGTVISSVVSVHNSSGPQTSSASHIFHWNGQHWNEMQLPSNLSENTSLSDVAFISDTNIWAIGANIDTKKKQNDGVNVIYHWDGTAWTRVANAPGVSAKISLNTISVIAPDNLWLLGRTDKNQPLMEHWDGKVWNLVSPTSPAYGSAAKMTLAGSHAWALVDEYNIRDAQKTSPGSILSTVGTVLETNC